MIDETSTQGLIAVDEGFPEDGRGREVVVCCVVFCCGGC